MIVRNCNIGLLAEMMGPDATDDDAIRMRDALLARGIDDTDDVTTEAQWLAIMDAAVGAA